jgi:hypothetical protein
VTQASASSARRPSFVPRPRACVPFRASAS